MRIGFDDPQHLVVDHFERGGHQSPGDDRRHGLAAASVESKAAMRVMKSVVLRISRSRASVMMPNVPSLPVNTPRKSYSG